VSAGGPTGLFIDINAYDITSAQNVQNTNGNYPTGVTNTIKHVFPVAGAKDSTHIYIWNAYHNFTAAQWGVAGNSGYTLYEGSPVLSVFNPSTQQVDGYFSIEQNPWNWTTATVEETHGFNFATSWRQTETITSWNLSKYQAAQSLQGEGITYTGAWDSWLTGWTVSNNSTTALYNGHGGILSAPRALDIDGLYSQGILLQYAPEAATYTSGRSDLPSTPCVLCVLARLNGYQSTDGNYALVGAGGVSGVSNLLWDDYNQNLEWLDANGRGFASGHLVSIAGTTVDLGIGSVAGTANNVMAAPGGTSDGVTNYNSNYLWTCGSYQNGSNYLACDQQSVVLGGTASAPNVTGYDSPVSVGGGALGGTNIKDFTAWQQVYLPSIVDIGGVNVYAPVGADLTAQTTTGTVYTFTAPSAVTPTYQIGGYLNVTAIATDTIKLQVSFTDENSNAITLDLIPIGAASPTITTTGTYVYPSFNIHSKAASAITVKTALVVSGGSITFDAGGTQQRLK
jgi:hypothetical protein